MPEMPSALLALEDGTVWSGRGCGAPGEATGEIVFNTSLTGYQEILTDPSYHGQLITMTMPHIGNYGTTPADDESSKVWAAALVVREISPVASNWRSQQTLPAYLTERDVVAITDVDTRALVRHIRTRGAMRVALSSADPDAERLIEQARSTRDMSGLDLVREVTCREPYFWEDRAVREFNVVAYDYGIKRSILRLLSEHGCRVEVVPATTPAAEVMARNPHGIFLSNGPGDPAAVSYAVGNVRELLGKIPIFGICLGHQILALALGAQTYKLKFGHRGGNQPVRCASDGAVEISTHNHGFAVDAATLPEGVSVSHVNLNDSCCEGLVAPLHHAFSVQYHPESSPGPHDSLALFDDFTTLMAGFKPAKR